MLTMKQDMDAPYVCAVLAPILPELTTRAGIARCIHYGSKEHEEADYARDARALRALARRDGGTQRINIPIEGNAQSDAFAAVLRCAGTSASFGSSLSAASPMNDGKRGTPSRVNSWKR
jgi:hypothetical protein